MNAIINGHEYLMSSGYGMDDKKNKYYLNIITDSIDELVDVIGDEATLEIPNELVVTGLSLNSITKNFIDANPVCSVTLSTYPYEDILNSHAEDIEAMAQAITELAEIIGGGE